MFYMLIWYVRYIIMIHLSNNRLLPTGWLKRSATAKMYIRVSLGFFLAYRFVFVFYIIKQFKLIILLRLLFHFIYIPSSASLVVTTHRVCGNGYDWNIVIVETSTFVWNMIMLVFRDYLSLYLIFALKPLWLR